MQTKTITIERPKLGFAMLVHDFPVGQDPAVEAAAIRYFVYHECKEGMDAGQREFWWGAEKEPKPRGPVQMKPETLAAKSAQQMMRDRGFTKEVACERMSLATDIPVQKIMEALDKLK